MRQRGQKETLKRLNEREQDMHMEEPKKGTEAGSSRSASRGQGTCPLAAGGTKRYVKNALRVASGVAWQTGAQHARRRGAQAQRRALRAARAAIRQAPATFARCVEVVKTCRSSREHASGLSSSRPHILFVPILSKSRSSYPRPRETQSVNRE